MGSLAAGYPLCDSAQLPTGLCPRLVKAGMSNKAHPFWASAPPPAGHDIARLRPASLPLGVRFETLEDAHGYSIARRKILERGGRVLQCSAERLEECAAGGERCGQPICPICARLFRRWLFGQSSAIVQQDPRPKHVVTLYIEQFPAGLLSECDIASVDRRIRARFRRNLPGRSIAIGGIEVSFDAGVWLVHGHFLLLGPTRAELNKLADAFGTKGVRRASLVQPVRDLTAQSSYLLKFVTYHRPGSQAGQRRPRAYPLPASALHELATWSSEAAFTDFLFLFGARRRGARIVLEAVE